MTDYAGIGPSTITIHGVPNLSVHMPNAGEKKVSLTGVHATDYAALIAACGTPTGAIEYATPAQGHLHSSKDKRDTFAIKLRGGLCYRFFGVADASIASMTSSSAGSK